MAIQRIHEMVAGHVEVEYAAVTGKVTAITVIPTKTRRMTLEVSAEGMVNTRVETSDATRTPVTVGRNLVTRVELPDGEVEFTGLPRIASGDI